MVKSKNQNRKTKKQNRKTKKQNRKPKKQNIKTKKKQNRKTSKKQVGGTDALNMELLNAVHNNNLDKIAEFISFSLYLSLTRPSIPHISLLYKFK